MEVAVELAEEDMPEAEQVALCEALDSSPLAMPPVETAGAPGRTIPQG